MPRDLTEYEDDLLNLIAQPDQIELVSVPTGAPSRSGKISQLFQLYGGYSDDAHEDEPIRKLRAQPEITPDIERDFIERAEQSLIVATEECPLSLWGRISRWITSLRRSKPTVTQECAAQLS
ncbi:hypothetical protein RAZWK3B_00020 [Roseobacter sp. AzwK-3b]|uniref:hypothetical protein n=1 Tax=Roseobacter sp. AzwK-3b TaxID=351016 RepID=UPI000156A84E|nr:hypothetical protein [Roseobacter sp. AzwK-3b]EDM69887.1 hypothetical protein RAZWK3B_00020 [Roseobacter sp. AzwK-3b]